MPSPQFTADLGAALKRLLPLGLLLALLAILPAAARAATDTPVSLGDLHTGGSSNPAGFTAFNGNVFFSAANSLAGRELWRSNGTAGGTVRITDIRPGGEDSSPAGMTVHGGMLFFTARNHQFNAELWRSNGEPNQAQPIEVNSDLSAGSFPENLTSFGGLLYFSADDGGTGVELWRSNGTDSLERFELNPGPASSNPTELTIFDGQLFFVATGPNGRELWRTDGTSDPVQVGDVNPDLAGNGPYGLTHFAGRLYFVADDGNAAHGAHLWRLSSATATPVSLGQIPTVDPQQVSPSGLTASGNYLYFSAYESGVGRELWRITDGDLATLQGLELLDINTNAGGSSEPQELVDVNGTLYFSADDGSGRRLWRSDGSVAGTVPVPAKQTGGPVGNDPQGLTALGGQLIFGARTAATGREVWRADTSGVSQIFDLNPGAGDGLVDFNSLDPTAVGPPGFTAIGSRVYFAGSFGAAGTEPWYFEPAVPGSGGGPGDGGDDGSGPGDGGTGGGSGTPGPQPSGPGAKGQGNRPSLKLRLKSAKSQRATGRRIPIRFQATCSASCGLVLNGRAQLVRKVRGKVRRSTLKLPVQRVRGLRAGKARAVVLRLSPASSRQVKRTLRSPGGRATLTLRVRATSPQAGKKSAVLRIAWPSHPTPSGRIGHDL